MRREGQASSVTGTQWEVVSALAVTIDRDWTGRGKRIVSGGGSAGVPLAQGLLRKGGIRIQLDERGEDGTLLEWIDTNGVGTWSINSIHICPTQNRGSELDSHHSSRSYAPAILISFF